VAGLPALLEGLTVFFAVPVHFTASSALAADALSGGRCLDTIARRRFCTSLCASATALAAFVDDSKLRRFVAADRVHGTTAQDAVILGTQSGEVCRRLGYGSNDLHVASIHPLR